MVKLPVDISGLMVRLYTSCIETFYKKETWTPREIEEVLKNKVTMIQMYEK